MSFPALTTALLISAAPLPSGEPPAAVPVLVVDLASIELDAQRVELPAAPTEPAPAGASVPSTEPGAATEPAATEPASTTGPSSETEQASPPQAASQAPGKAAGQEDIVVTGRRPNPADPLQELNAESYQITQSVDKAFVAPVAFAYKEALPSPIRTGVRNFLNNLSEPVVFLNFLLQLKPGKAAETFGRFTINTTLGIGGLRDVAKRKPFNLPYRENGFANTLGYYGIGPGPYFYLPLVGSTTLRDFIGNRVDQLFLPTVLGSPFNRPYYVIPAVTLTELDNRIEFDERLRKIKAERDPYVAAREFYLRTRQAEIDALRGRGDSTIRVIVADTPAPAPAKP